jgi:hypothetical protein
MSLNTGGSTTQQTTAPGNTSGQQLQQGQIGGAFNAAGGLGNFASPSTLYNLTPDEQAFQGMGMGLSLPGSQASRALGYVQPGTPGGDMFQNYFKNFIAPTVTNNAIAGGYGGASGANMEALSRAGQQAAMQGLTSYGMPMAQADQANAAQGLNYAGLQRQTSIQDLARVQNLLQSLTGMLPSQVAGGATTNQNQGPGTAASLANLAASALLGGTGAGGSSLLASLLGPSATSAGSGLSSWLSSLFSSSPSSVGTVNQDPNTWANYTNPSAVPESDPNAMMMSQIASEGM